LARHITILVSYIGIGIGIYFVATPDNLAPLTPHQTDMTSIVELHLPPTLHLHTTKRLPACLMLFLKRA
jgi:hypothetical protein